VWAWVPVMLEAQSLRWPIASHFVVDLLSMSIVVFMNQARLPGTALPRLRDR
jgi:hypothetical protein